MTNKDRKADVVMMKYGSHLYKLNTANSDTDFKGIFLNTVDELVLGEGPHHFSYTTGPKDAKNGASDVDYEIMSLHTFIKDAIGGQTYALDMLHSTEPETSSTVWKFLVANRTKFYSKNMKSYVGYVKSQAAKYGQKGTRMVDLRAAMDSIKAEYTRKVNLSKSYAQIPSFEGWMLETTIGDIKDKLYFGEHAEWIELDNPKAGTVDEYYQVNSKKYQSTNLLAYTFGLLKDAYSSFGHRAKLAEANEGIDWKALSHALRAGYQALHIYRDGDYEYPLPETDFLKAVKNGELDYKTIVAPTLEKVVELVDIEAEKSTLPEKADEQFWKEWLVNYYRNLYDIDRRDKGRDYIW